MKENSNAEKGNIINVSDINSLIPAEERAIDTTDFDEEDMMPEVEVVSSGNDMSVFVPEDEKDIPVEEVHEYNAVLESGYLTPAAGFSCLKTNTSLSERIFALVRINARGQRTVEFCQKYSDGSYSPTIAVKQSELFYANLYHFNTSALSGQTRTKVNRILDRVRDDYLSVLKYNEAINIFDILKALIIALPNLPEYCEEEAPLTPEAFYKRFIDAMNGDYDTTGKYSGRMFVLNEYKAYYALTGDNICELACRMGMKKGELLMRLKQYNLLYLTNSSKGYQTKIRLGIDPETEKPMYEGMYCIYKMQYISEQLSLTQSTKDKSTEG